MKNFVLVGLRPNRSNCQIAGYSATQSKHGKNCTLPHVNCAMSVKLLKRRKIIFLLFPILELSITKNDILKVVALLCANPSKLQLI